MQLKSVSGDSPDARLTELGFNLPPVPEPVADYLTHTQIGPIIYTSGMLHWIGGVDWWRSEIQRTTPVHFVRYSSLFTLPGEPEFDLTIRSMGLFG